MLIKFILKNGRLWMNEEHIQYSLKLNCTINISPFNANIKYGDKIRVPSGIVVDITH